MFYKAGFGQKRGSPKKNCALFWGGSGFTRLLLHDVTRCFRRVLKQPYENRFFEHALERCKRN